MNERDREALDEALHGLRVSLAEQRLWPSDVPDLVPILFASACGLLVGISEGMGWWSPLYAALLGGMATVTRWMLVAWARQGVDPD